MSNIYFPQGSQIVQRNVVSSSYVELILQTLPNTVFFFDSSSQLSTLSQSQFALTSSWAINSLTASFTKGNLSGSAITASNIDLIGPTNSDFYSAFIPARKVFTLGDRGGWGSFQSYGAHITNRLGECLFHDTQGSDPVNDGGSFNCEYVGGATTYDWHWDTTVGGAGTRCMTVNSNGVQTDFAVSAGTNFIAQGSTGYTGPLNDSTTVKIADVVGGIITAVYF